MINSNNKGWVLGTAIMLGALLTGCDMENKDKRARDLAASDTLKVTDPGTAADTAVVRPKKTGKGKASVTLSTDNKAEKIEKDKDGIYTRADIMPQFPGGEEAMRKFIEEQVKYPDQALEEGVEGNVRVVFVVDEAGNITNTSLAGDKVGNGLDEEALIVVGKMPKWKPGIVKGKKVKTRLQLPISFQIVS